MGRRFQTPAALWAGLLPGGAPAGAISRGFGPVLGYTVLHVLTFVVFGIVGVVAVRRARTASPRC